MKKNSLLYGDSNMSTLSGAVHAQLDSMRKHANLELKLFKEMLRIRMVEEKLAKIYPKGEMKTPAHFSIGQEAVSVGVCAGLKKDDWIFNSHRCHAGYLAKGGSLKEMVAELFGKLTGACKGRGGSAHLMSCEANMYSAPILSAMIPVAVGVALSLKMDRKKHIAVAFFGDAALEEGAFAESINFAVVKKLPVFFVCENNFFSTHTHILYRQPDAPIFKRVRSFGIEAYQEDGMDAMKVYKTSRELIKKIRQGKGPLFLECITYRFLEHVGPNMDFDNPYRKKREVALWMEKCPIARLKRYLVDNGIVTEETIDLIRKNINREIEDAIEYARRSPWPRPEDLLKNVY